MKSLNFDTGVRKIPINGNENNCIEINIGDVNLLPRMQKSIDKISRKVNSMQNIDLKADGTPFDSAEEAIKAVSEVDQFIRDQIDFALGGECSSHIFGEQSTLSMVGGVQLWERVMIALVPLVKSEILAQQKLRKQKLDKYLKK